MGSYYLNISPIVLACAVLGSRLGKIKSSFIATIVVYLAGFVFSIYKMEDLREIFFTVSPMVLWWLIGSLVVSSIDFARQKIVIQHQMEQRDERLRILHILHDSVANDLVYAISRSRMLKTDGNSQINDTVDDIVSTLEIALSELRRDIIEPTKHSLDQDDHSLQHEYPYVASVTDVRKELAIAKMRLSKHGFIGIPQINGDISTMDDAVSSLLSSCIKELTGNMIKYGQPGDYALGVDVSDDEMMVIASNTISPLYAGERSVFSSNVGLESLTNELEQHGGTLSATVEDGEWSVCITLPLAKRTD